MLSSNPTSKLLKTSLFGAVGVLAIGLQPASAISLSGSASTLLETGFGCNNITSNILGCYGFNNFDNSDTWLTAEDGSQWAIKGTIIAAGGNINDLTTADSAGYRLLTFTNATIEYKGGGSGTLTGFTFSHDFDFTTRTSRGGIVPLTDPKVSHRLSGRLESNDTDGLAPDNQVVSSVSFSGTARLGSTTNADTIIGFTDALETDSLLSSGVPSGDDHSFFAPKDASMASLANVSNTPLYLYTGTISATLNSITLAQGDTLFLPASECTVVYEPKGNNGVGDGSEDGQPAGDPPVNDGPESSIGNPDNKRGSGGPNFDNKGRSGGSGSQASVKANAQSKTAEKLMKQDKLERLCNKVARSVIDGEDYPTSIPEPNSAFPVLGGLIMWGAGILVRKRY